MLAAVFLPAVFSHLLVGRSFSSKQRNFRLPRCKILELPFLFLGIFVNTAAFSANIEFYCGNFQACVPLLSDLIISPACGVRNLTFKVCLGTDCFGSVFPGMQCAFSEHILKTFFASSLWAESLHPSSVPCYRFLLHYVVSPFAIFCNSFSPYCC